MARFLIKAKFLAFDEFEVEAETEAEALALFDDGEAGDGHSTDYQLYDGPTIKLIEE